MMPLELFVYEIDQRGDDPMPSPLRQRTSRSLTAAALLAAATALTGCGDGGSADGNDPAAGATPLGGSTQVVGETLVNTSAARPIDFGRDIRPILSDNCFFCHGPDSAVAEETGGLRLDSFEGATAQREDADPAIVPGDPDNSPL